MFHNEFCFVCCCLFLGEIADLSLNILSALLQFRPKHLPELKIRVRIGIHTGSCCAGKSSSFVVC